MKKTSNSTVASRRDLFKKSFLLIFLCPQYTSTYPFKSFQDDFNFWIVKIVCETGKRIVKEKGSKDGFLDSSSLK